MDFEFDQDKSASNKEKHGIDFIEAQMIWRDAALIVAPARFVDEVRYLAVGRIGGRHWSAVFMLRDGRIRLISVRRSREHEIDRYEGE